MTCHMPKIIRTCCVLHNMQMKHDGFFYPDLAPSVESALNSFRSSARGDSLWRRNWEDYNNNNQEVLEQWQLLVGQSNERRWAERVRVLLNHFEVHMQKKGEEDDNNDNN